MKFIKSEQGFTLIEMMIVLLIISVLVLIAVPNVSKHAKTIDEKGCEAYMQMVEGQIAAYRMEKHKTPTSLSDLGDDYLPKGAKCPDDREIMIDENGKVVPVKKPGGN
ncbi:competence type IV pilus major pilin ComGC [Sporosarcina sp. FSL W8-0480]|uniref:competence type IV pilus major pilin ComGC n=1 Tax=Sporosarcina sp. FSL W8-0480 TaxID=2954701 RepID=UPI0030D6FE52